MEASDVDALVSRLADIDGAEGDDSARIDLIAALERAQGALSAAQSRVCAAFADSQEQAQRDSGVRARDIGKGVAAQLALARRQSLWHARRHLSWSRILVDELPETHGALTRGETSAWRAMIVAKETLWLSREARTRIDAAIGARLGKLGDRQTLAETRRLAYAAAPAGFVARGAAAESERRVGIRPAPDTMARLTALLPVAQAVAAHLALTKAADTARAEGDERTRGQVMADTLVERVTGQSSADAVPVKVELVMPVESLVCDDEQPVSDTTPSADLRDFGPIPTPLARRLVRNADEKATAWVRRLFTRPDSGDLVAAEAASRAFPAGLAALIVHRDRFCRTPWCGAPIRHLDHAVPAHEDGDTSFDNGQGLCEACNYVKEAAGWQAAPGRDGTGEVVTITTPTGHTYTSHPPPPPGRAHELPDDDPIDPAIDAALDLMLATLTSEPDEHTAGSDPPELPPEPPPPVSCAPPAR